MNPDYLRQFSNHLRTRMGACFPGEKAIFRGYDLHKELGNIEWFDLYVYSVTGKRFQENELKLLQTIWIYTSYPDARIWNNRVASLAGSYKSTANLATSASLAISEAELFGRGIDIRAISFLLDTKLLLDKNHDLEEIIKKELRSNRSIAGYGRPLASGDERIKPIMEKAKFLNLAEGPHVKLAFKIDEALTKGRWRLKMNYGAIAAAVAADIGLSANEYYQFMFPAFLAGMQPCYIEASEKPAGTLFPTSCNDIKYEGLPKRSWAERK